MTERNTILWISDAQVEVLQPKWRSFRRTMMTQTRDDVEWAGVCAGWMMGVLDALGIEDEDARRQASRRIRGASANDHRGGQQEGGAS